MDMMSAAAKPSRGPYDAGWLEVKAQSRRRQVNDVLGGTGQSSFIVVFYCDHNQFLWKFSLTTYLQECINLLSIVDGIDAGDFYFKVINWCLGPFNNMKKLSCSLRETVFTRTFPKHILQKIILLARGI